MSEENKVQVTEFNTNREHIPLEYIYVTIPAEYVCVYHRILAMMADYGEDMLKDCKSACKDRNSNVIDCFNMFNAAVAARKLSAGVEDSYYGKLAATLIKYIKAKINQIYKGKDNSTSFVFPVDENGQIMAFVSCGERPRFWINPEDGDLYEHKFDNGFDEHFRLGKEDESGDSSDDDDLPTNVPVTYMLPDNPNVVAPKLLCSIKGDYELVNNVPRACADVVASYDGVRINLNKAIVNYYFDGEPVIRFHDVKFVTPGNHQFKVVVLYKGETAIANDIVKYESTN